MWTFCDFADTLIKKTCPYNLKHNPGSITLSSRSFLGYRTVVEDVFSFPCRGKKHISRMCHPQKMFFRFLCSIPQESYWGRKKRHITQRACLCARVKYQSLITVWPEAHLDMALTVNSSMQRHCFVLDVLGLDAKKYLDRVRKYFKADRR